jgi:hypothetical protein
MSTRIGRGGGGRVERGEISGMTAARGGWNEGKVRIVSLYMLG